MRLILITGAGRGLGALLAEKLAGPETHLLLLARSVGGLEETDDRVRRRGGQATLVPLDLMGASGIEELALTVADRWGRLDGLVANAALLPALGPVATGDPVHAQQIWATNFLAPWRLLRVFDPLLRNSAQPAVLVIDCGQPQQGAYWGPYAASKAALAQLAHSYAAENNSWLRLRLVDPGPISTRLRANAFPGEPADRYPLSAVDTDRLLADFQA